MTPGKSVNLSESHPSQVEESPPPGVIVGLDGIRRQTQLVSCNHISTVSYHCSLSSCTLYGGSTSGPPSGGPHNCLSWAVAESKAGAWALMNGFLSVAKVHLQEPAGPHTNKIHTALWADHISRPVEATSVCQTPPGPWG